MNTQTILNGATALLALTAAILWAISGDPIGTIIMSITAGIWVALTINAYETEKH